MLSRWDRLKNQQKIWWFQINTVTLHCKNSRTFDSFCIGTNLKPYAMVIQREQYVAELLRKRSHPQGLQCRCGYRHQEWTKKIRKTFGYIMNNM